MSVVDMLGFDLGIVVVVVFEGLRLWMQAVAVVQAD